jgi:hypothetical protein
MSKGDRGTLIGRSLIISSAGKRLRHPPGPNFHHQPILPMNRLLKAGIAMSILWIALVALLYLRAYFAAPPLREALRNECPDVTIHVIPASLNHATISRHEWVDLIAWHDQPTGSEISLGSQAYRQYRATMTCAQLKNSAEALLAGIENGVVKPELKIKYRYMAAMALVPTLLLLTPGIVLVFQRRRDRADPPKSSR